MAGFKKETENICDFREDTVVLVEDKEVVILEIKVCVKGKNKTVKLDWSVDECVLASDDDFIVTPNVIVEYRLCRNGRQIGSTVKSRKEISVRITGLTAQNEDITLSLTDQSQPNFTFCDETPDMGINCYQVKAILLPLDMETEPTNSAVVMDRSLVAVY